MRDRNVISTGLQIVQEFRLSTFGLSWRYLYCCWINTSLNLKLCCVVAAWLKHQLSQRSWFASGRLLNICAQKATQSDLFSTSTVTKKTFWKRLMQKKKENSTQTIIVKRESFAFAAFSPGGQVTAGHLWVASSFSQVTLWLGVFHICSQLFDCLRYWYG